MAMLTNPARLSRVTKHYGDIVALDGIDLDVRAGETVAVLGPNGAGKTTVVRTMLGLIEPTSGRVSIFGESPRGARAAGRVGAMLQVSSVPPMLTVREHIELFSSYYARPLPVATTIGLAALDRLTSRRYAALSGGEKQRLAFALAICGDPALLFLDEPSVGLDVETRRLLWERVREFVARGKSIVLTTHHLDEAEALADRAVVLVRGTVVAEGTPTSLKSRTGSTGDAAFERAYLSLTKEIAG